MAYKNEILLDVFKGNPIERPPIWIMRQAGRILPGYRKVRASVSGFKELVKSPDLIAEVTIEPLDVLKVDAAILFSDILVIPEAMGLDYDIIEKKGPVFVNTITSPKDVDRLTFGTDVLDPLSYVFESIDKTKKRIDHRNPLIGFSGAPWTLFAYMIEGSGSKTFSKARKFLYQEPEASHLLMSKITDSIIYYIKEKIHHGVDLIQLFDSWSDMLPVQQYREFCMPYLERIFTEIRSVPKIFFPKGGWSLIPMFHGLEIDAISIDWKTPPQYVRSQLGHEVILQGNMDPCQLYADVDKIKEETKTMIDNFGGRHIVNLGHGVYPDTSYEHVQAFVEAVRSYRYN